MNSRDHHIFIFDENLCETIPVTMYETMLLCGLSFKSLNRFLKKKPRELRILVLQIKTNNSGTLIDEDKIRDWILLHLSKGKRGFMPEINKVKVIQLILKRMKKGRR